MCRSDFVLVILALLGANLTACGSSGASATVRPAGVNPTSLPQIPVSTYPKSGSIPASANLNSLNPNTLNLLTGTYGGTIYSEVTGDFQDYTIRITTTQVSLQQSYAYYNNSSAMATIAQMSFSSNGPLGNIQLNSYLNPGALAVPDVYTGNVLFSFATTKLTHEAISVDPEFSFNLEISLKPVYSNAGVTYQFDPTQSKIFIMDCGFSKGVDIALCSVPLQNVLFDNDFGKR